MRLLLLICVGLISWETAQAETKKTEPAERYIAALEEQIVEGVDCKKGTETRRLEVRTKDTGCTLMYTKAGNTTEIARSKRSVELCKDNLKKVRATLSGSGYSCG